MEGLSLEWMAWTFPTAVFFGLIFFSLFCLTILEVRLPTKKAKGFLPMKTTRGERFFISLLASAFIMMIFLGLTGLSPIVGAFAGGVVAGESGMTHRIREEMKPLNFLLVPIFFVYIGSEVNIQTLASLDVFLYGMLVSLLAFVGKYVSALGAMGKGLNTSLIGIGMSPRGEVGLIFVAVATTTLSEVVTADIISIIIWMVIVTTVIAPILLNRILQKVPLSERDDDERFESPVVE